MKNVITLDALGGEGEELPTEFRLFTPGWNNTKNGRFLFDKTAAASVMSAYKAWGVDLAIDLEHNMLDVEPGAADPTARDARGWCKLELRPDGSLWACDVKWTADGAQRLKNRTQRYVSPAFECDPKTKRVTAMMNIAITAIPATHKTPALVAANQRNAMKQLEKARRLVKLASEMGLDSSLVKQALDAVEKGDAKAALEILKNLIASAAGAEPEADGDEDGSEGDGAEGVAPAPETEAVEDPKVVDSSAAPSTPPPADGDGDEDEDEPKTPAKKAAYKAMSAMFMSLTGAKTFAEAVAKTEVYRASHLTLETETKKLAQQRATLESAERRSLVVALVKLGAEFPSTVWADDSATTIKPRWLKMPITELRAHLADQKAARKAPKATGGLTPPPGNASGDTEVRLDNGDVMQLSASEIQICKSQNCDPKEFATLKAYRDGKKGN